MNALLEELSRSLPDAHEAAQVTVRLLASLILKMNITKRRTLPPYCRAFACCVAVVKFANDVMQAA